MERYSLINAIFLKDILFIKKVGVGWSISLFSRNKNKQWDDDRGNEMQFKKVLRYIITALYIPVRKIYKVVLRLLPIDTKQVLFSSFPDYSDNSKVLYQYMVSNPEYNMYHFVWLVDEISEEMSNTERTVFVRKKSPYHIGISFSALKAIATSKYIFYTHYSPILLIDEKTEQTVINLWHGCGYKDRKTPIPKKKQFDYGLVPGSVFVDIKSKFWGCKKEQVLPIGYPRYDQMKNISKETYAYYNNLKGAYNRIILWMPTYRKTERNEFAVSKMKGYFELPLVNSVEQLQELDKYCRDNNTLLCVKRHPKQIRYKCENISFSNIKFINNQDLDKNNVELYGLLACVDGLISDYSSCAIDFLLINKPIAFSLNDMVDYRESQGFVFDDPLMYMPGHHLFSLSDMFHYIDDICEGNDPYQQNRYKIICNTHNPCDNYCERICKNFIP